MNISGENDIQLGRYKGSSDKKRKIQNGAQTTSCITDCRENLQKMALENQEERKNKEKKYRF